MAGGSPGRMLEHPPALDRLQKSAQKNPAERTGGAEEHPS